MRHLPLLPLLLVLPVLAGCSGNVTGDITAEPVVPAAQTDTLSDPGIYIATPSPDSEQTSPLRVQGEARESWFRDGAFPVRLQDESGNLIAESFAGVQGDLAPSGMLPFEASIAFETELDRAMLVLEKAEPSDEANAVGSIVIPVRFVR